MAIKTKKEVFLTKSKIPSPYKKVKNIPLRELGRDIDGNKICPFDFIATIDNNIQADPFMEQADANCRDTHFNGYIIDNPISKAWKGLEYALLNTIKKYKEPIILNDQVRKETITIFPKGGKNLDVEKSNPIQYYPTFQITYHGYNNGYAQNNHPENTVDYEYFQISAEQRAWIALNLMEKLA